ncbi:chromosome partitioning protein ParB [Luteimonas saliphila]|uniref:chromosome partitioning protein ParB n=1 Tax=Luteimonas saliphila TaxID=2804919 RepID=UPI00192E0184|nr:chromosome partitioning protein ParB [Luteimonas saliphila]
MAAVNTRRIGLGPRPTREANADVWVRGGSRSDGFTARMTVDVTPALRSRIKVIAFQRELTVAEMLRTLLEREFGEGRDAP